MTTSTLTLPAGRYAVSPVSEATLVGTRNSMHSGLFVTNDEARDASLRDAFLDYLYEEVDANIHPVAGEFSFTSTRYGVVAFRGDDTMGLNHNGWTDGCFIVPVALWEDAEGLGHGAHISDENLPSFLASEEPMTLAPIAYSDDDDEAQAVYDEALFPFTGNDNICLGDADAPTGITLEDDAFDW